MMAGVLRSLGIATLLVGYPVLAHYTNAEARDTSFGAAVAVAPLLVVAGIFSWRSSRRLLSLTLWLAACIVVAMFWSVMRHHFGLVYLMQHVGMQLALLLLFGRTLIGDRRPLCTRFAEAVHAEPLSPEHEHYARQVTVAWSLFFATMAAVSVALFFTASIDVWSVFANFLTLPLVALMFVVEFLVRRRRFPELERAQILDAFRAFRDSRARP